MFTDRKKLFLIIAAALAFAPALLQPHAAAQGSGNCAVTGYQLEGQARSGFVRKPLPPNNLPDSPHLQEEFVEGGTAIIVVDDFTTHISDLSLTHGEYVVGVLTEDLNTLIVNSDWSLELTALLPNPIADEILVDVVDIAAAGYSSDGTAELIAQKIAVLHEEAGITNFVVNLSFGLVPCIVGDFNVLEFLVDFESGEVEEGLFDIISPEELFAAPVTGTSDDQFFSELINFERLRTMMMAGLSPIEIVFQMAQDSGLDPLQVVGPVYTAVLQGDGGPNAGVVTVASAGNYRDEAGSTPLAPARFAGIVAVSAFDPSRGDLFEWSQDGEFSFYGGEFTFSTGETLSGTSFAAPLVAALIAQTGSFCRIEPISTPGIFDNSSGLIC